MYRLFWFYLLWIPGLVASLDEVKKQIEHYMARNNVPGIAAAVVIRGEPHILTFGFAGSQQRVTADTLFELGSLSKTFTATLLALEVERGHMKLDDKVADYLPYIARRPCPLGSVTLEQLATHTSGLPRMPSVPKRSITKQRILHSLLDWYPADPPAFLYSNLGFNLLGYILENSTHLSFGQLVREAITGPLGMSSTVLYARPVLMRRYAQGYNKNGRPVPPLQSPNVDAAGGLRSTARDMLRYLQANLLIKGPPEILRAMNYAQKGRFRANRRMIQGLAWQRIKKDGILIIDKNGGVGGFSTWMGMAPASKTGLVLLSNKRCNRLVPLGRRLLSSLSRE